MIPLLMHGTVVPTAVYFVFGLLGTALHLWRSPVLEFGANRQTAWRLSMGASVGVILPAVGGVVGDHVGVPAWLAAELPLIVKGFAVFVLSLGGSYVIGDEVSRRAIGKAKAEADQEEKKP